MTIDFELSRENRYHVRFPYNLKQNFKETFKTARWEPDGKYWHIGGSKANLNKLNVWVKAVEAKGVDTFTTTQRFSRTKFGHPDDMDIPIWDEKGKYWYDAEY
ncbi:hypothetical protein [Stenotrophomonas maltophilia]|uniref:hypothetical protein n=1 Tax=Stenotrophomonas maltophilia TaxID=40324 RepID=UPI0012FD9E83|nr:hypothetical protein [Stenotrophomonas maltophilia]